MNKTVLYSLDISSVFEIISNILLLFILICLAIHTAKDILAKTSLFSYKSKIGKFLYSSAYDEALLTRVFEKLGVKRASIESKLSSSPDYKFNELQYLLWLLLKYIHKTEKEGVSYGIDTPVRSGFYLNTMATVHNEDDLAVMVKIIDKLVSITSSDSNLRFPNFIITPKSGNPILGYRLTRYKGPHCFSLIAKSQNEKSFVKSFIDKPTWDELLLNFEGINSLRDFLKDIPNQGRKLRGVVVNGNLSGGSEIIQAMEYFNSLVESSEFSDRIEKVTEAFVLYRVDDKADVDTRFEQLGFKIFRLLDLNEDIKIYLHKCKIEIQPKDIKNMYGKKFRDFIINFTKSFPENINN